MKSTCLFCGWICHDACVDGWWLVNVPQCGEKDDIAALGIREEDLKESPILYARVSEEIRARFEEQEQKEASSGGGGEVFPGFMV